MQERNFGKGTIYIADKCEGREPVVAITIISNPDPAVNAFGVFEGIDSRQEAEPVIHSVHLILNL